MCFLYSGFLRFYMPPIRMSVDKQCPHARQPSVLQYAVNCDAKGRLLHAKRPPFATRKAAFWKTVDNQSVIGLCYFLTKRYGNGIVTLE